VSRATVTMAAAARRAIVRQARAASPRECCGFLLGQGRHVRHVAAMNNAARSRTRFRVRDRDHLALRRVLRAIDPTLEIVGVYHSHPQGPARPSPTDVAEAYYREWIHVIADVRARPVVRAFRIADGRVEELAIRLVSSGTPHGRRS